MDPYLEYTEFMARFILLTTPRSGSTYCTQLLRSNPDFDVEEDILNPVNGPIETPLQHLQDHFRSMNGPVKGFKVFPEQLLRRNVRFDELVDALEVRAVIVLWRRSMLEQYVSLKIAIKTQIWYCGSPNKVRQMTIDVDEDGLKKFYETAEEEWKWIAHQWPIGVKPIFLCYEDLLCDTLGAMKKISSEFSSYFNGPLQTYCVRQNPAPLSSKISNWDSLSEETKQLSLNVETLLSGILRQRFEKATGLSAELIQFTPDLEPLPPPTGWRYRVSGPYISNRIKENVLQAVYTGNLSSATHWVGQLSGKLKSYYGCPVAQPCANGFSALYLALQSLNISKDDEVIIPTFTMIAVGNAVSLVGGTPVFADCAPEKYNPTWHEISQLITPKTKAVIVCHTYGVPCADIETIAAECKQLSLALIEDISECVGVHVEIDGQKRPLGTFGDFACASLYANKIIHGGDGGFVICNSARHSARLSSIVNHGFTRGYHFLHFEKSINAKISGLAAAVACGCMDEMENILQHRKNLAVLYRNSLKSTPLKLMDRCGADDTPWVFGVVCESKAQRTALRKYLAFFGIETRDFFYPLHIEPCYMDIFQRRLPNAEVLGSTGFYLPTQYNLDDDDLNFICAKVLDYFSGNESDIGPPHHKPELAVVIKPGTVTPQVLYIPPGGEMWTQTSIERTPLRALSSCINTKLALLSGRWDSREEARQSIEELYAEEELKDTDFIQDIQQSLSPYTNYFESISEYEQSYLKPWLDVDLMDPAFDECQKIETTTEDETIQFVCWLIDEIKPKVIMELGSLFGHFTLRMAIRAQKVNKDVIVYACDNFKYASWMKHFVEFNKRTKPGRSFLRRFKTNVESLKDNIIPVEWEITSDPLPESLSQIKSNLIFMDFTRESEDLEQVWKSLEKVMIPGETFILFNGLDTDSIKFFTQQTSQLMPVLKPSTIAQLFLYDPNGTKANRSALTKRFNFPVFPNWDHQHRNAFEASIQKLQNEFQSNESKIQFIPAVGVTICDHPELLMNNQWIGVIHAAEEQPEHPYVPGLRRICSKSCEKFMKNCLGLFTLTSLQKKYLEENLKTAHKIPIQLIHYPMIETGHTGSDVPKLYAAGETIEVVSIGAFLRDYRYFAEVTLPARFHKVILGADVLKEKDIYLNGTGVIKERLNDEEYELLLKRSIVFLSLKTDGLANTVLLECICRNVPIIVPNISSCTDYCGKDYPLLYEKQKTNFHDLLTESNIKKAIEYLTLMDKSKLKVESFVEAVRNGPVVQSLPSQVEPLAPKFLINSLLNQLTFDVTICICSYKRTHNLQQILNALWNDQDYKGSFQIIVWNNNESRKGTVEQICYPFMAKNSPRKSLELISSTQNYLCTIRLALAPLMRSEALLVCDDDIVPSPNFVSFFMKYRAKYPEDVLCLHGHKFLNHKLDQTNPRLFWEDYQHLKFVPNEAPEQFIHYVHADCCLIPKAALRECVSVEMPDPDFALVDDYWLSYILNYKFKRNLRKLSSANEASPIRQTDDSEDEKVALYRNKEVIDARIRMYVHHMANGWPSWTVSAEELKERKINFWKKPVPGFNVSCKISEEKIQDLVKIGTKCVRIGVVGLGDEVDYELRGFLTDKKKTMSELKKTLTTLENYNIMVILTLDRRLASLETWEFIAEECKDIPNLVGYDLINEPFTKRDTEDKHWLNLSVKDEGVDLLIEKYAELIKVVRKHDSSTPIIVEPNFWAFIGALEQFDIQKLLILEKNLIVSCHFYEPSLLTNRYRNKNRFRFPGDIPVYEQYPEECIYYDHCRIYQQLLSARKWADKNGVIIFIGEAGIARETRGALSYLGSVINFSYFNDMSCLLYAFAEENWDAMNYELGEELEMNEPLPSWEANPLMQTIIGGFSEYE